jgi:hypothetical protein
MFLFDMGVGASSLVRNINLTSEKLQTNYHAFEANHDVMGVFFQALQTPLETSQLNNVANISNMGKVVHWYCRAVLESSLVLLHMS